MSTYNGWTNRETWCVNLWLTNDEYSDATMREMAREAYCEKGETDSTYDLASAIRAWVSDEIMPDCSGLAADLLNAALADVDWCEIAEHALEDVSD